jgi:glycosyltransferase involved in cell wall biosynthesis
MTLSSFFARVKKRLSNGVVTLHPKTLSRGRVLLSYTTLPFLSPETLDGHTNRWECRCIATLFSEAGYTVDIIDYDNTSFLPKYSYDICLDVHHQLERIAQYMKPKGKKVYHATTAHWKFNNDAEQMRLKAVEARRGVRLQPRRIMPPSRNAEVADIITVLGNSFTQDTYRFAEKQIVHIPLSSTHTFPFPSEKNLHSAANRYVWIGGAGMAHKGLDLVLEAFSDLPKFELSIFGKADPDFINVYNKELFKSTNIHFFGSRDPLDSVFQKALFSSVGCISPSCSEGGGGSTILAMHAGLIPIVSYENSVDIGSSGIVLSENTVSEIKKSVQNISTHSEAELLYKSKQAWEIARSIHTRPYFEKAFKQFMETYLFTI